MYDGSSESIELALIELRKLGCTQMQCLKILVEKLQLTLKQANTIVYHAEAWQDQRGTNDQLTQNIIEALNLL
jgi:hypothetical protein